MEKYQLNYKSSTLFSMMWADDLIIFSQSAAELQSMLNTLENWTEKWPLTINWNKTEKMVFRNWEILRIEDLWFCKWSNELHWQTLCYAKTTVITMYIYVWRRILHWKGDAVIWVLILLHSSPPLTLMLRKYCLLRLWSCTPNIEKKSS